MGAGEGKKGEMLGGPAEGSRGSAQILDAHENFEHTPHRHTTPHRVVLGKGERGLSQESPWSKKQDMSNKLSRRAAP